MTLTVNGLRALLKRGFLLLEERIIVFPVLGLNEEGADKSVSAKASIVSPNRRQQDHAILTDSICTSILFMQLQWEMRQ